jgi:hypothetical protein
MERLSFKKRVSKFNPQRVLKGFPPKAVFLVVCDPSMNEL